MQGRAYIQNNRSVFFHNVFCPNKWGKVVFVWLFLLAQAGLVQAVSPSRAAVTLNEASAAIVQNDINYPVKKSAANEKVEARLDNFRKRVSLEILSLSKARGVSVTAIEALDIEDLTDPVLTKIDHSGRIHVYVIVDNITESVLQELRSKGLLIELAVDQINTIQGWLGYDRIDELARLEFVQRVQLPDYAISQTGSVTSQGDSILNADDVRGLSYPGPFDGTGVKIGAISDGVDNRGSAIGSGDLPASGITLHPTITGSGDEGTAMLEIIHDLAPGADLYFAGPGTSAEMVSVINWMANTADCDVICDDLGFFGQPYFEDGSIAQAARNAVVNSGRVYCTSAGNQAEVHYQGLFTDMGEGYHDFKSGSGTDQGLNFAVDNGDTIVIVLQWDDQFGSSGNDYDLYILNSALDTVLASSDAYQNGNDDPIEAASYTNSSGSTIQVCAVVRRYLGSARTLEIFALHSPQAVDDDATTSDSIFGHAAVAEVVSCATINASDPGLNDIAYYSSRGPSTIRYPSSQSRQTPRFTGVDGVSITGCRWISKPVLWNFGFFAPLGRCLRAVIRSKSWRNTC